MRDSGRDSPRRRTLLVLALSAVPAPVAAELVLRGLGLPREVASEIYLGEEVGGFGPHPTRFYAPVPGHRHAPHLAGRFATGEWPYRGRAPGPAPGGERERFRVAAIGDSCIYGFALDPRDTVPERIRAALVLPPPYTPGHGARFVQALVVPAGEPVLTLEKRWSEVGTIVDAEQ